MDIKNIEFEQDSHGMWDIYVTFEGTDKEIHLRGDEDEPRGIIGDISHKDMTLFRLIVDEFEEWIISEKEQRQHDLYDLYNDR